MFEPYINDQFFIEINQNKMSLKIFSKILSGLNGNDQCSTLTR